MKKALVVHSMGLDELTPMGHADILEATQDSIISYRCALRFPEMLHLESWLFLPVT